PNEREIVTAHRVERVDAHLRQALARRVPPRQLYVHLIKLVERLGPPVRQPRLRKQVLIVHQQQAQRRLDRGHTVLLTFKAQRLQQKGRVVGPVDHRALLNETFERHEQASESRLGQRRCQRNGVWRRTTCNRH